MKHIKTYNESIKDFLKPKSDDKIGEELFKLSPDEILKKSIEYNYTNGFKYLIDNNLVDETTKYLIEKYKLGLHRYESLKNYEEWFLEKLNGLNVYKSKHYDYILIYIKKNGDVLFNYDEKNYIFYYSYSKIYSIFESKFNLSYQQMNILIRWTVEETLKIRVDTTYRLLPVIL